MNWATIQDKVVTTLQTVTGIQEVSNYEKSQFRGYPAATVVPSESESDFQATQERERIYAFRIRLYVEVMSDQHGGEGLKEADRILRTIVDRVMDEFDKPANARLGLSDVLFVVPVPSAWSYDTDRNMRVAEITLGVHSYIDTNQL